MPSDCASNDLPLGRREYLSQALNLTFLSHHIQADEILPLRNICRHDLCPVVGYWPHSPGRPNLPTIG